MGDGFDLDEIETTSSSGELLPDAAGSWIQSFEALHSYSEATGGLSMAAEATSKDAPVEHD